MMSPQELDLVVFSEKYGYLRMDKVFEKSQIISFLLVRTILYNIILPFEPPKK